MELPVFNDNLRSSGSWMAAVDTLREQWRETMSAADNRRNLAPRARMLQLLHTLPRMGHLIDERTAALLALQSPDNLNQSEPARLLRAATLISEAAATPDARLTRETLARMYRALAGAHADADVLRQTESLAIGAAHHPLPATLVPKMLDNALDWFTTDGVGEMHIIERAVLVYMRLLDIQPFPLHHDPAALLAASFYLEREGLPPLILFADELNARRFPTILESAFRMLTQPMVEFFAENVARTMQIVPSE
ncbi:MAG: hypothetical protein ACKV2V_05235 [Blastocatellia bacterium]